MVYLLSSQREVMDQVLKQEFISHWELYFPGEPLPITFEISPDLRGMQKAKSSQTWRCFVCDLAKVRKGADLAFDGESITCQGGRRYCGYQQDLSPDFRYFLSHGIEGKLEGERYKKSPELVDEYRNQLRIVPASGKYLLFKRWDMLTADDSPSVVIFFARGEVLSGLFTLANFDSHDPFGVITPMGSGCSSIVYYPWYEEQSDDPKAVLGMMDPSARPCIPLDMMTFAVPIKKFTAMVRNMNDSFLITPTWDKVKGKIQLSQKKV